RSSVAGRSGAITATLPVLPGANTARFLMLLLLPDDAPGGTLIVIDLAAPGVSREPVGDRGAAVLHLIEVSVSPDARIGAEGDGQSIVARLAARPAAWLEPVADLRSVLDSLLDAARALPGDASPDPGPDPNSDPDSDADPARGGADDRDALAPCLAADPTFRHRHAELAQALLALEALELRVALLPPTAALARAVRAALPGRRARLAAQLDTLITDAFGYYSTVGADPRAIDNEGPIGHHSGVAALRARRAARTARAVPDWFGPDTPTLGY
ncbi:MAG: hypothetical protein ACKOZX_14775, partial [Gammaproteobacteria bacterium]